MKKGISLVALVVTIIVLIILAGTVILTVLDVNIFEKAKLAKEQKNLKEVYVAVQNEVLGVQQEKIGLAVSTEFATHLQARLLKNYPTSNATATYDEANNNIGITFDLSDKTYELSLDRKYRLTMLTTIETGDTSEFEKDLIKAMEDNFDNANNRYNILFIQKQLDEKYQNVEYLYYIKDIVNEETIYIASGTGIIIENLTESDDTSNINSIINSNNCLLMIKYDGKVKYIEDGQLKDQYTSKLLPYIKEGEKNSLYRYTDSTINKYLGEEEIVTIPMSILREDPNSFNDSVDIIDKHTFKPLEGTKVDVVTTLLQIDYTTFNSWGVAELVNAIEGCDLASSEYYEEGMDKIGYGEAYINSYGAELIVEDSKLYTYVDDTYRPVPIPRENKLKEIIIYNSGIELNDYCINNPTVEKITFYKSVDRFSSLAFANCPNLTDIYMTSYTKEEVQALTNYSSNKWGAPNATIHCKNNETL